MAGSRKSPKNNGGLLIQPFQVLQHHLQRGSRIVVALSGGVDSVVLCDLLRRYSQRRCCELRALHINHQISPNAAQWARFCRALCRAWKIPLTIAKVSVKSGNSLEASARAARYRVFAQQHADCIALAHNQDDQAETLLLQLLRGAGVRGLSAMPVTRTEANVTFLRPLLDVTRDEIEAYAWKHKIEWIEDESNSDIYFDRNFLRHKILPVLAHRYPAYRTTLARAGRNLAESAQLLDELAAIDLDGTNSEEGVAVALLSRLGTARAKNALRYHLRRNGVMVPNAARLEECVRQALTTRRDARLSIDLDGNELRYFAEKLFIVKKRGKLPVDYQKTWRGETRMRLKELGGTLTMRCVHGRGISIAKLDGKSLTVRLRRGGENLQPDANRPRRSLKNLLQETRIPPWQRAAMPLLYCGRVLICVPGVGIDAEYQTTRGESGVVPGWEVA